MAIKYRQGNIIYFLCLALLLFVGCSKNHGWQHIYGKYYNPTHKFSVDFPDGWIVQSSPHGKYINATYPSGEDDYNKEQVRVSVRIAKVAGVEKPDEFDLGKGRADISRGNALIDGIKAEWIMYKISATLYKSYTIQQDTQVYYITYSATDAGIFGAFAHHFEYIVSSMKFHD